MSDNKILSDNTEPTPNAAAVGTPWSWYKKLGFRIIFVFFLAMSIPLAGSWYSNVFTLDWFHPHYRDIYDIARFQPSYRALFGGKGYDMADGPGGGGAASDDNKGAGKKQHGGTDTTLAKDGGDKAAGGHHHHHNRDSSGVANSTGIENIGDAKDGGDNKGEGHHHHHNRDSSGTANVAGLAIDNHGKDGHGHHHRDSLATDSAGHSLAKAPIGGSNNDQTAEINGLLAPKKSFLADYTDWGIAFLIGVAGGLIWTLLDRKSKSYNILYYWIRVVVRYRAGIGIIGFGFTKLFPTQMPYPSLGLLNTNFGDYTAQKIYWLSVGSVPWYQVFGGIVEIVAGGMLFFRKTTTFGAILLIGALGDITFVNYAYDGGVHVYAFYFVFLSLFLVADDLPKLYNLLILERYTIPFRIYPDFKKPALKYTRIVLKALVFIIFFGILTYTEVINFKYDPYKQPSTAGVKQLRGNYHVTDFKINGQDIPYNPLDTVRWQEATFENWTTLTFRVNHPVLVDPSNGGGSPMKDIQRTFEISGTAGGQRAFHYYADTVDKVLYLQDKNVMALRGGGRGGRGRRNNNHADKPAADNWISKTAWQHIGDEKTMIDKNAWSTRRDREFAAKTHEPKRNRMVLKYSTVDGSRVILTGINEHRDSIYVVLDRYNRKYILPTSTLSAGKY